MSQQRSAEKGCVMTHEEIGRLLGLTHQRVQQIEAKAIRKLRAALVERGIRADDLIDKAPPQRGG